MAEIWVTPRACSECLKHHDEDDDYGDICDCWCHERDQPFSDDTDDWDES